MKDIWKESSKKQKSDLVQFFSSLCKKVTGRKEGSSVVCTHGGERMPHLKRITHSRSKISPVNEIKQQPEMPIQDVIPLSVMKDCSTNLLDIGSEMLSFASLCMNVAEEISSCNTNENQWARVLEKECNSDDPNIIADAIEDSPSDALQQLLSDEGHIASSTSDRTLNPGGVISGDVQNDFEILLNLLRTDLYANKKGQWDTKTTQDLEIILADANRIQQLLNTDLR
jgi:hypothetical protein